MFERIGKIGDTFLGIEDHGIMSFFLHFDFGGTGQGFGGYCLDTYDGGLKKRIGTAGGLDLILGILRACGVEKWEDIKGKTMYALYDNDSYDQMIKGIKALPFESGGEFLIEEWQKKWFPGESKNERT